jgi:hypothetical protein
VAIIRRIKDISIIKKDSTIVEKSIPHIEISRGTKVLRDNVSIYRNKIQ